MFIVINLSSAYEYMLFPVEGLDKFPVDDLSADVAPHLLLAQLCVNFLHCPFGNRFFAPCQFKKFR